MDAAPGKAGLLTIQDADFESSMLGVKLSLPLFLSLQDNKAKSKKPKCSRSAVLKLCVKAVDGFSKTCCRRYYFFFPQCFFSAAVTSINCYIPHEQCTLQHSWVSRR